VSSRLQVILTRAARGLIAGSAADSRGLEGRQAALLYFDELQITDPFTAVSLKGSPSPKRLYLVQSSHTMLYFDELQITDTLTVVLLKGAGTPNCLASVQPSTFCHIERHYLCCFEQWLCVV
jgi:hypothetical protein